MKLIIGSAAIALVVVGLPATANAKGCIKGALVGGIAGHYAAHHGVLGAAAGCFVGRHEANRTARQNQDSRRHPSSQGSTSYRY